MFVGIQTAGVASIHGQSMTILDTLIYSTSKGHFFSSLVHISQCAATKMTIFFTHSQYPSAFPNSIWCPVFQPPHHRAARVVFLGLTQEPWQLSGAVAKKGSGPQKFTLGWAQKNVKKIDWQKFSKLISEQYNNSIFIH